MLSAQLYTLREFTKTPADIARTLARVRKIGYRGVQCSALGPVDPKELATMLQGEGLTCVATHVKLEEMEGEPQRVIDEHHLWGCKLTAVGGFFPKEATAQTWVDYAARFNAVAKRFAGSGVAVGYHNHSHELAHFDGKPALAILIERLDPSVWFEIDTYWITHGGGDPAAWIRKCAGRIPAVHLKDMLIKLDRTQYMAEVGEGNLNWPAILDACEAAGAEHLLVEQDTCYRDPFESIEISYRNLTAMGAA
ncbi:MAG TPA: sugar phosphate isomerase/epimerase [Tepidisphaeraceae bacterium]|nr:sugar phosphate isomerase/epimerase [Tepidisphaeraceae bacterium]